MKFPTETDLNDTATTLLRLQKTYKIKTTDLADGKFHDNKFR